MGRRRDDHRDGISSELRARIAKLAGLVWQRNQSRMGRDLKTDQAAISRILAGKQQPSAKLLEKLASRPGVNVAWLFLGHGEPLVATNLQTSVGQFRPLLDDLLPGPLTDNTDRLSGLSYPIAAPFHSETCYWYRIPDDSPITRGRQDVLAGDMMLMETHQLWTNKLHTVLGRFCGLSVGAGKSQKTILVSVNAFTTEYFENYEQYYIDSFGELGDAWLICPTDLSGIDSAAHRVRGARFALANVVCVCARLERTFNAKRTQAADG